MHHLRNRWGGLWGAPTPKEPKIIVLRGEARRPGLDVRESSQSVEEALNYLCPAPFSLHLGCAHKDWLDASIADPIARAWQERNCRLPAMVLSQNAALAPEEVSLTVYEWEERHFLLPKAPLRPAPTGWAAAPPGARSSLTPKEALQLELARVVAGSLQRWVNRDFARALAEEMGLEVPTRQLGRLSKSFRLCLQSGLTLPPPVEWAELARSAPFDDIGLRPEVVHYRPPLSLARRTQWLLESAPPECGELFGQHRDRESGLGSDAGEQIQALEEFFQAAREPIARVGPEPCLHALAELGPEEMGLRLLRAFLLTDRLTHFQDCCRQEPQRTLQRILRLQQQPAPTLPIFLKFAVLLHSLGPPGQPLREFLQFYLGRLPTIEASPEQVDRVLSEAAQV